MLQGHLCCATLGHPEANSSDTSKLAHMRLVSARHVTPNISQPTSPNLEVIWKLAGKYWQRKGLMAIQRDATGLDGCLPANLRYGTWRFSGGCLSAILEEHAPGTIAWPSENTLQDYAFQDERRGLLGLLRGHLLEYVLELRILFLDSAEIIRG